MVKTRYQQLKKWFLEGYDKRHFSTYRADIDQYNIDMLRFFNTLVLLLLAIVFASGFFTGYVADMQPVYVGTAIVTALEMVLDSLVLFKHKATKDVSVFLCMTKLYVFCIISGVYYSLDTPAISYYVFMIVLSILFIVRPWKMGLYNLLAGAVFCICSYRAKPAEAAMADIYNCCIFYLVSAAVSFWIIKLRVGLIRNEKLLTIQRDTDILTTLPNKRRFNIYAKEAFDTAKDKNLSFLMMDIDHFKAYNDTKGHIAGDYCLESIGKALRKFGEEKQIFFARYGGEEFIAVDTVHRPEEIHAVAQEIVETIYALGLPHESSAFKRITISVGYASQPDVKAEDYMQLLERADEALYRAKQQGRNKISS